MTSHRNYIRRTVLAFICCGFTAWPLPFVGSEQFSALAAQDPTQLSQLGNFGNGSDCNQMTASMSLLETAYQNALLHDSRNADMQEAGLQEEDHKLEDVSLHLSSLLVECTLDQQAENSGSSPDCQCLPTPQNLRTLADTLSSAAYRLVQLPKSGGSTAGSVEAARISSMAHLYRMLFALTMSALDQAQSEVYLGAAQGQIKAATAAIQLERDRCACNVERSSARLSQLAELDATLTRMRHPS